MGNPGFRGGGGLVRSQKEWFVARFFALYGEGTNTIVKVKSILDRLELVRGCSCWKLNWIGSTSGDVLDV